MLNENITLKIYKPHMYDMMVRFYCHKDKGHNMLSYNPAGDNSLQKS